MALRDLIWTLHILYLVNKPILLFVRAEEIGTGVKPLKKHSTFFENRLIFQLPKS